MRSLLRFFNRAKTKLTASGTLGYSGTLENGDGTKEWWRNGQRHREDGPAYERADGYKAWYRNGQLDREDGPAIEYADGTGAWFRNGKRSTATEVCAFHAAMVKQGESEIAAAINDGLPRAIAVLRPLQFKT